MQGITLLHMHGTNLITLFYVQVMLVVQDGFLLMYLHVLCIIYIWLWVQVHE